MQVIQQNVLRYIFANHHMEGYIYDGKTKKNSIPLNNIFPFMPVAVK